MTRLAIALSLAAAFAAGCSVTHLLRPALAAGNIIARVIHTGELERDALGMPSGTGMRSKLFVAADGMTISIQDGNVAHAWRHQARRPHPQGDCDQDAAGAG